MARIKINGSKEGLTNNKKREDALFRIYNLEQGFAKLVESVNESFKQIATDNTSINNHIKDFDLVIQSMMEVLDGSEKKFSPAVAEVLKRLKIAELEAKSEKQLAELKVMETEGKIIKTDAVTSDNDFVVTSTKGEDGSQRYPSKSVGIVGMFIPSVKELLIGKKVNETIAIPTGGTLEVLEIYKLAQPIDEVEITTKQEKIELSSILESSNDTEA